jgi:2-hydroxychromene-2-carboxylate isomerase
MPRTVDYYFSLLSPWAYIGHAPFMDIVRRHGVTVNHKPVALAQVFADTGGLPLPKRHPARQRYRMFELQRWREKRGLTFHLHPKFWPFDGNLADRFVIAIAASEHDPDRFLRAGFAGVWEREQNLGEANTLTDIARAAGLPAVELLAAAMADAARERYEANVREAIAADAFGSPCYVLDGEVFWGQDRLDLLDDALGSGRPPYRSDA